LSPHLAEPQVQVASAPSRKGIDANRPDKQKAHMAAAPDRLMFDPGPEGEKSGRDLPAATSVAKKAIKTYLSVVRCLSTSGREVSSAMADETKPIRPGRPDEPKPKAAPIPHGRQNWHRPPLILPSRRVLRSDESKPMRL